MKGERRTLYRINWALHKQGKHACTNCLTVFDWTAQNFDVRYRSIGRLHSVCKTCRTPLARTAPSHSPDGWKRQRLARVLRQS